MAATDHCSVGGVIVCKFCLESSGVVHCIEAKLLHVLVLVRLQLLSLKDLLLEVMLSFMGLASLQSPHRLSTAPVGLGTCLELYSIATHARIQSWQDSSAFEFHHIPCGPCIYVTGL